jgi:hypothetical protein
MSDDPETLYAMDGESQVDTVYIDGRVSVPEVTVVPEQPYPSQEVFVIISFYTSSSASVEYSLTQNESAFDIYVIVNIGILPVVRHHILNVSLGQPAIGSYEANIRGLYYPRTFNFVVDYVHSINHVAEVYEYPFVITTESNSTVSAFAVDPDKKQIGFNVSREDGIQGYCNVTIPKLLLDGVFSLLIDETPEEYAMVQNSTHSSLYFTYSHSARTININGTVFAEPPLPKIFRVPDVNPTIQQAISTANSGDTIRVKAGTYYENLLVDRSVSIIGEGQATTVIDGGESWDWVRAVVIVAPNVSISGFTIERGRWEDVVVGASNCRITHNKITGNGMFGVWNGIVLYGDGAIVSDNNIIQNEIGIRVENYNNTIYHNNFISNQIHVEIWVSLYNSFLDNGYPSGGNYWSGHAGIDIYSGPFQNETGSDGIADDKYTIDSNNIDNYPLMAPISTFDAGTWNNTSCNVQIVSNSTVSDFRLNETEETIEFTVTGETGLGFSRVTIPNLIIQDLWQNDCAVLVDNQLPLEIRNWTDPENTYLYFTYQHSQHQITIIPESPSITLMITALTLAAATATLLKHKKRSLSA